MSGVLDSDIRVECQSHGVALKPTLVCCHLKDGTGLGFNTPDEPLPDDVPYEQAWCDACDQVLMWEGGWNDASEAFASPVMVCDRCFEEIKRRNEKPRDQD
jgi:hypothetical protein